MAKQPGRKTSTKKAKSKAAANAAAPAPKSPGKHLNHVITIRALDPQNKEIFEASLLRTAKLEQLAEKWTYILRARSRWAHDLEQRKYFGSQAVEDLKDLGVKLEFIERLSTVIHIEVELHHWDTQDAEAARIGETASEIPWEYLISAATRSAGRFQPLLITRLFRNGRPAVALPPPELVLFVESAPGRLKDLYEFDDEEDRHPRRGQCNRRAGRSHGDPEHAAIVRTFGPCAAQKVGSHPRLRRRHAASRMVP